MSGTVYGLGVGPGDPELITVKALRLLRSAPVLAYPAPDRGDSLARAIVASLLPGGQEEIAIRVPMSGARFPALEVYDAAAETIAAHAAGGRDVAVLCEGDPFFYGSFMYLYAHLEPRCRVEVVPGVSSLTACAAVAGAPLAGLNDVLCVLPARLEDAHLRERLRLCESAAIIKLGRHFARVRDLLEELGLAGRARYVERATMGAQRLAPLHAVDPESVPYFSMILVHSRGEAWR